MSFKFSIYPSPYCSIEFRFCVLTFTALNSLSCADVALINDPLRHFSAISQLQFRRSKPYATSVNLIIIMIINIIPRGQCLWRWHQDLQWHSIARNHPVGECKTAPGGCRPLDEVNRGQGARARPPLKKSGKIFFGQLLCKIRSFFGQKSCQIREFC